MIRYSICEIYIDNPDIPEAIAIVNYNDVLLYGNKIYCIAITYDVDEAESFARSIRKFYEIKKYLSFIPE